MNDDDAAYARYGRPPPPRANWWLSGHDEAERRLVGLAVADRLPHAWLISGPAGIGKATLAFRFARWLLAKEPAGDGLFCDPGAGGLFLDPAHPVFRRVASGGHADLLTIERAFDDARGRLKSEIPVDEVRRIPAFFAATPAEGSWRIVIVDGADWMNRNAANALLKILEEPPSRCPAAAPRRAAGGAAGDRAVALPAVGAAAVAGDDGRGATRPLLAGPDGRGKGCVAALTDGSIGRALTFASSGGIALHEELHRLLRCPAAARRVGVARLLRPVGSDRRRLRRNPRPSEGFRR